MEKSLFYLMTPSLGNYIFICHIFTNSYGGEECINVILYQRPMFVVNHQCQH